MKESRRQPLQELLDGQTKSDQVSEDELGHAAGQLSCRFSEQIYSHLPPENQKIVDELGAPPPRHRTRREKELLLDTVRRIRALVRPEAEREERDRLSD